MTKYHFNKDTGRTGKCEAKIQCRLGLAESEHFETREEAQAAFENSQDSQVAKTLSKSNKESKNKNYVHLSGVEFDLSGMRKEDQEALRDKWNEHYKTLDDVEKGLIEEPQYVSPEDLLTEGVNEIRSRGTYIERVELLDEETAEHLDINSIKGDYVVIVQARQGGGNRECYCEGYDEHEDDCLAGNNEMIQGHPNYVADYDDSWDSTYNSFVFDNGITEEQYNDYSQKISDYREFESLKMQRKLVEENSAPAWFINDAESFYKAHSEHVQIASLHRNAVRKLKTNKERNDLAKKLIDQVNAGKNLDKLNLDDLRGFSNRYSYYDVQRLQSAFEDKKNAEKFKKMYDEAEQLEDGSELKEYLLGDRGTGYYEATEKRGRRNVKVRKSFERGSLFGSELKTKLSLAKSADETITKFLEPLKNQKDDYEKTFNQVADLRQDKENARQKVWESGWVYDSPVPKMPKEFLVE